MRLKHPEFIMDHWYQCGFCDHYSPNKSGLYQHKRAVHFKPDESKTPSERSSSIVSHNENKFSNGISIEHFKMSPIVSYEDHHEPPNTFEYIKTNKSMEIENTPMDEPEDPLPMVLIPDIDMKMEDEEFSEENITDVPIKENRYTNITDVPMEDRYILSECLGDFNLDNLDGKLAWLKNA